MKKKCLALIMALCLLLPNVAFAAADTAPVGNKAVRLLNALDVMPVDEYTGEFWDETPVRRSEMAKILFRLMKLSESNAETPVFKDVSDSDRPYVEAVVKAGYMNGYSADVFGADDYVTNEQIIKIFVSLIGGDKVAEQSGGYPNGYIQVAVSQGITKSLTGLYTARATRLDVANFIYNALNSEVFTTSGNVLGNVVYETVKGRTFLTERMNLYRVDGIVTGTYKTKLNNPAGVGKNKISVEGTLYDDPNAVAEDFLGQNVTMYVEITEDGEDGTVIYAESKDNEILTVADDDIVSKSRLSLSYYEGNKKKTVNISPVADMVRNGRAVDFNAKYFDIKNGFATLIDNDCDGVYDVVFITDYITRVLSKVGADSDTIYFDYNETALDLENVIYSVVKNGEVATLSDLADGDVLLIAQSAATNGKSVAQIIASDEYTAGSAELINETGGTTYVTVRGTEYKVNPYFAELVKKGLEKKITTQTTGKFLLDANGDICGVVASTSEEVGYIVAYEHKAKRSELFVKIFTSDGKMEIFESNGKITLDGVRKNVKSLETADLDKLATRQLVKYKLDAEGKLDKIVFPLSAYSINDFSLDAEGSYSCTNASILNEKYYISSDTKLFAVPDTTDDDERYFSVPGASYFVRDTSYDVKLYDIENDGTVSYAVVVTEATPTSINYLSSIMVVDKIGMALDSDGNDAYMISGYNENGTTTTILECDGGTLIADLKKGDVIQYVTDSNLKLLSKKILKASSETAEKFYGMNTLSGSTKTVFGEVGNVSSKSVMVAASAVTETMRPIDMAKRVSNNSSAVYEYDSYTNTVSKISFGEIVWGDKIFACVNGENTSRIIVVYR